MTYFTIYNMPQSGSFTESELPAANKIISGNNTGVMSQEVRIGRFNSAQPAAFTDEVTKQDPGFEGTTINLTMIFHEEAGTNTEIAKLRNWSINRNVVKGTYPHGRIGLRNNWQPEFNLHPTSTAGYKITNISVSHQYDFPTFRTANLTLEFSGNPDELG